MTAHGREPVQCVPRSCVCLVLGPPMPLLPPPFRCSARSTCTLLLRRHVRCLPTPDYCCAARAQMWCGAGSKGTHTLRLQRWLESLRSLTLDVRSTSPRAARACTSAVVKIAHRKQVGGGCFCEWRRVCTPHSLTCATRAPRNHVVQHQTQQGRAPFCHMSLSPRSSHISTRAHGATTYHAPRFAKVSSSWKLSNSDVPMLMLTRGRPGTLTLGWGLYRSRCPSKLSYGQVRLVVSALLVTTSFL